jgi:hypothetical protein
MKNVAPPCGGLGFVSVLGIHGLTPEARGVSPPVGAYDETAHREEAVFGNAGPSVGLWAAGLLRLDLMRECGTR